MFHFSTTYNQNGQDLRQFQAIQEITRTQYPQVVDVLKQFQNEVNDIRSERLARSANPLALLAAAQPNSDNYYEAPVPQRSNAPQQAILLPTIQLQLPDQKGKENSQTSYSSILEPTEQGVPLQADQADWLEDTDEELIEQELNQITLHGKIQEVSPAESSSTDTPLEQVQNHDENDVFDNVRRHSEQPESINDTYVLEKDDSLMLDPYVITSDPANRFCPDGEDTVTLEKESRSKLDKDKELDELESEKADFSNIYDLLLEECVSKDVTCSYLHSLSDLNALIPIANIGDEIYSTVDACNTSKEMWTAIERLQQGESLNVQDVKTNLFWEFGKFTSRDGESMESYYSRFYKLMNELTRNNLQVSPMQVNVQFLQQLQPEWSRFVTVVKQRQEIDTVSYHKLFDVLKQFQNEVNDIRSKRLAKIANPHQSLPQEQVWTTRHKGKEIAKPVTPQSESVSEEDSDPEQALRDNRQSGNAHKIGIQCFILKGFGHYAQGKQEAKALKTAVSQGEDDDFTWQRLQEVSPARNQFYYFTIGTVVNQKHDELVKKSLLTRSQFEGQLKEKSKVISDLKVKEGKDIDTMIEMDKQIKFLNEILYKRNQSIQTIHMLAPKCATYNGRSTFANPKYLKIAQSEKPRLYEIPYDTSDPANRFCPNGEETVTLEKESRSKLDKDKVKPYDYTYQNSLYETFKPPSKTYLDQLERAKEVRKTMWRKTFNRTKPNIAKNVSFLPVSKSISKSRQVYNEMTNNFNHFRTICKQTWSNHTNSAFPNPTAKSMEVLIKTLLMPLSDKTILDSHCFVTEMHDDLEYVKSLEKEVDELESEKADFLNIYDLLLEE
ncbi:hypothetical protein Tco_1311221, partial [Tanacetum coccineum]